MLPILLTIDISFWKTGGNDGRKRWQCRSGIYFSRAQEDTNVYVHFAP